MEYNKLHFHKINDHKVLHKVKKHWVVVSMALLSAMGTTGLLHSQDVHASTNHAQLTGNQQSAVNHGSLLAKVNQDQLHQRIVNSVQELSQQRPQSIHTQINQLGRNAVQHGLNKQQQTQNVSSNQGTDSASQLTNVQQPTVGRTMSAPTINHQQIVNAVKKDQQRQQRDANAKADLNQLDQRITETAPLHETGTEANPKPADVTSTVNSQLNDIDNQYASINDYYNDVNTANNSMQTSYNVAHLDVSRYYNSCTTTYDGSNMASDNGGGSASEQLDSINSDLTSVAKVLKPEVSASIDASYISSVADGISMNVQTNGSAQNYATQVSSLDSEIDSMCTTMSSGHSAISKLASDVSIKTSLANSDVASVSSQAATDASNVVKNNNLNAPIVDVSTNKEMECAMKDGYIHQINIVKNMNMWYLTAGAGANTDHANDPSVPPRDLTIDGLNEQGKWNVYDGAGTEWDLDGGTTYLGSDPRTHLIVKNLHTYGTNYFGPWSFWGSLRPSQITYDNFSYDGAQLNDSTGGTQNVNEDFAGKVNINVAGAYSPSGKYQNYNYDTGGLSPVPYADEKNDKSTTVPDLAVCNSNGNDADNSDYTKLGVDLSNDQQVIESYGNVTIDPHCDFKGYTLDGDAVQMDGNGTFEVGNDAKVLLVPRGTHGENTPNGGSPAGIYLKGSSSQINVDVGATLDIYPSVATNGNMHSGGGNYDCAPYAIYDSGTGSIDIADGGTININYPDIDKYTPKQFGSSSSGDGYYSLPEYGVVYINKGSITAEPYSSLIVNGGNPGTAWNTSDPDSGNLVRFDTNTANSVNADAHSTVRLIVGGTEPMTMFRAPSGDSIQVTDPKEFSLDGSNNKHAKGATQDFQDYQKKDQLDHDFNIASSGVGIEGDQVIAHDAITGKSYGQFARFALPGGAGAFDTGPTTQANGSPSVIGDLEKGLGGTPGSTGATLANFLPYALNPTFNQAGVDSIDHTINVSYLLGMNGVNAQAQDQTFHMGSLLDNGQIPNPQSMIYYNTKTLPISDGGFNFSQGFTFLGVPSTYVEGLNVQKVMKKGTTNQPLYKLVSGYANPGSYIKLRTLKNSIDNYNSAYLSDANPMSAQLSRPIIINQTYFDNHKDEFGRFSGASQLPNVFDKQVGDSGNAAEDENGLNDQNNDYAPGDAHPTGYIAMADNHTGAWSYKLPVNFNTDNLVVSDRNQTLEYPKAARLVKSYMDGMNRVLNGWTNPKIAFKAQSRPADSSTNADEYDADSNNFPISTYPKVQSDGQVDNRPTGLEHDPTGTDDDEANQVQENEVSNDDVNINYIPLSIPSARGYREDDDTNAGQYFKAGYFKGLHDLLSMQKDNAISSMPEPFLIGYEAAQLASMDPNSSADIQNIIDDVEQVKHDLEWTQHRHSANTDPDNKQGQHYYPDYLPRVNSDNTSTSSDVAKLSSTVSNLDTLANEVDVSSGTHTTLGDLNTVSSLLHGSMTNADQNSSSILTDQSQVSSIDSDINQMLSSLYAAQKVVASGMANYNAESRAAVRASNAGNTNLTTLDNTIALTNVSSVNDAVSNAYPASDIANSEDSSASNFVSSADNDYYGSKSSGSVASSGVSQDNITIRSSASNAEANDFASLANSYNAWGSINDSFVNAESQLAHQRFVQISNYQAQYTSASNTLSSFASKYTTAYINTLSGAAKTSATNVSNSVSAESSALSYASVSNAGAFSNAQNYDNIASGAFSEIASQITSLSNDATKASNNNVDQKNQNDNGHFDMAGMLNGTTFSAIASVGGASAAQTIESTAVNEVSTAESAWDQIANLIRRAKAGGVKTGRSLMRMVRTLRYSGSPLSESLPSNLGRGLIRGSAQQRHGLIDVSYRDVNTGQILDTIVLSGHEGKDFDLSHYENNLPSGNHSFAGVQQGSDVTQFEYHDGQPQKVVINVASAYGMVRVHFVQASSINAANRHQPSAWRRVPNSIDERLTGKIGDDFSPEYYEYNTPEHTKFAYLAEGSEIDSYQPDPQDLYIAVDSTDHRF